MPTPLVVYGGTSAAEGTALGAIRPRLAAMLGHFTLGTVTTQAASLDADRQVISTQLQSAELPPAHLDGLYLYVRDGAEAGAQRLVQGGAYDGPYGVATVDQKYASGPLAPGTAFELSVLPARAWHGMTGLNDCINLGLETLGLIDLIQETIVADADGQATTQIDLSGLPWQIAAVDAVYYPRTSTTAERRREMPRCWDFVQDAENTTLSFRYLPANIGDVIEVKVRRPATTRIKVGGVWGDATAGLVDDSDACLYDAGAVVSAALPIALERLALRYALGSPERAKLEGDARAQRIAAGINRFYGRKRDSGVQRVGATGGARGRCWW